jgi:hypothetical protein
MKHVSEMNETERAALAAIKRGPKPEPMPSDRHARDLSKAERDAWVRE